MFYLFTLVETIFNSFTKSQQKYKNILFINKQLQLINSPTCIGTLILGLQLLQNFLCNFWI